MNDEFNVKNSSDEDWTVSKPNENLPPNQQIIEPIEDWGMTGKLVAPHKNGDGWKMPEPKFRKSDGASVEEMQTDAPRTDFQNISAAAHQPPNVPSDSAADHEFDAGGAPPIAAVIEPQPDISVAFTPAEIETPPAPVRKERSRGVRIFLAALGIFAMFAFAVIFLAVVYFLFFYRSGAE